MILLCRQNSNINGNLNRITNTYTSDFSTLTVTTGTLSATFTAPNTTDSVIGCVILFTSKRVGGTFTIELQESTVTVATITVNFDDIVLGQGNTTDLIYFQLATPYQFTTTSANAYRWRFSASGGTGNCILVRQNASTIAVASFDTRTAVAGSGDQIMIASLQGGSAVTLSVNANATIGLTSGLTNNQPNYRDSDYAIWIGSGGILDFSASSGITLNVSGRIVNYWNGSIIANGGSGGTLNFLALGKPQRSQGIFSRGIIDADFDDLPLITTLVGGDGSTGSPLELADDLNLQVNERIVIGAGDNGANSWNNTEYKFIRTVISPTEFTLSDTAGGAESALSNTHFAGVPVTRRDSSFLITSDSPSSTTEGWYFLNERNTSMSDVYWSNVKVENIGNSAANYAFGFTITSFQTGSALANPVGSIGKLIVENIAYSGLVVRPTARQVTVDEFVAVRCLLNYGAGSPLLLSTARQLLANKCAIIDTGRQGLIVSGSALDTTGFVKLHGVNKTNIINGSVSINTSSINGQIDINSSRQAIRLLGVSNSIIDTSAIGTIGENDSYVLPNPDTLNQISFVKCNFGENAPLVVSADAMLNGSYIAFQNYNNEPNRHFFYTDKAFFQQTGPGLPDTTLVVAGASTLSCEPYAGITEDAYFDFKFPATINFGINIIQQLLTNSSFDGTITYSLYRPNENPNTSSPVATSTLPTFPANTVQVASLAWQNDETENSVATLRIFISATSAGGKVYLGPFNNARTELNPPASLDSWENGLPARTIQQTAGSPADVWNYLLSLLTIPGTTGFKLRALLELGEFIGLKDE